jgi:sec-independent protein translocase protein TatA
MFGVGTPELIFILLIALIIFGPGKLPELGGSLGRAIHNFKKALQTLETEESEPKPLSKTSTSSSEEQIH